MKNFIFTPSSPNYSDTIVIICNDIDEIEPILKSHGFTDEDMTEDYKLSHYADCYIPPEETNSSIEELSKDFNVVYVYEKNRKYEVICGFEIKDAIRFKNINTFGIETTKEIINLELPKGFLNIILENFSERLTKLKNNNYLKELLLKIPNMNKDDLTEYLSSNRIRKYNVEYLREILKDETEDAIEWLQKDIEELKEMIFYLKKI